MKTTLLRAGALSCALLASTALTAPAQAQSLPPFNQVDGNGVDLVTGDYFYSMIEGSIGSGDGALRLVRNWAGAGGWTDNWSGILYQETVGATTQIKLQVGTYTDSFIVSGGTYTSTKGDGATLTSLGGGVYRYVARDGTQIDYATKSPTGQNLTAGSCTALGGTLCGIPTTIRQPSGMTYTMNYDYLSSTGYFRWRGVSNSANYAFTVDYATNTPGGGVPVADWYRRAQVQFTNLDSAPGTLPTVTYSVVSSTVTDVTDTGGQTWRFTINGLNLLSGVRRPGAGSDTTAIGYVLGRVNSVANEGVTTHYIFTTSGTTGTVTINDPNAQHTVVVSDLTKGRVTSITDPLSRVTGFQYDSNSRLTRATRPEGNYIDYTYDARGNTTETRAVAKSGTGLPDMVMTASYDSTCSNVVTCNQPNSVTDARGNTTDFTYDSTHGGVLSVTQPAPSGGADRPQTRYSYTQVTAVTGEPVYMLTGVSACASGTVASSCVGTTSESRQAIAYDTDNLRATTVTARNGDNSLSATNAMTYDQVGNLLTVDGPLSGSDDTTRYRYDAARRVIGVVGPDPDGGGSLKHRAVRSTYTNGLLTSVEQGNVNSQSDGDWASFAQTQRVETDYDSNARPIQQRLMSGSTTYQVSQASYDNFGRIHCTVQRMNPAEFASLTSDACALDTQGTGANDFGPDRITRTTYDNVGQVTKVETGYGTSDAADEMQATYRNNGQVETVTDANGNMTTYVYDGLDRLSQTQMPSPSTPGTSNGSDYEQLTYATATVGGNTVSTPLVSSRRTRDGNSIGYSYDALNRLTAKDLPSSPWYNLDRAYTYDNFGRLASADGNSLFSYSYDGLGRMTGETNPFGTVAWQYDAAGRRTRMTWPDSFYVDYDYLVTGEVTKIRENGATSGAGVLGTYAYDDLGRRTSLTRGNGAATGYSYDNVSQLTQLTQNLNSTPSDVTFDYVLNPAGEIASATRSNDAYAYTGHANANVASTVNGLNQVTAIGGASVTHDGNGNVASVPAAGSLTGAARSFTYNAENALTTVSGSSAYQEMMPDSVGRLFRYFDGTANRWLVYDGNQLIAETNASASAFARRYVPGPDGDEPLVWYEGSGTTDRRWLHADERGSVIAVSDGSGDLIGSNPNRYDEYGNPQGSLTGRFGYTGQAWLPEIGMYDYRARAYNPATGRFMQTDPIGMDGGMNIYAYVGNNPVNFTDPLGLDPPPPPDSGDGHVFVTGIPFPGVGIFSGGRGSAQPMLQPGPFFSLCLLGNCANHATVTARFRRNGVNGIFCTGSNCLVDEPPVDCAAFVSQAEGPASCQSPRGNVVRRPHFRAPPNREMCSSINSQLGRVGLPSTILNIMMWGRRLGRVFKPLGIALDIYSAGLYTAYYIFDCDHIRD